MDTDVIKDIRIPVIRNFFSNEPKEALVIVKQTTSEVTYQAVSDTTPWSRIIQQNEDDDQVPNDRKLPLLKSIGLDSPSLAPDPQIVDSHISEKDENLEMNADRWNTEVIRDSEDEEIADRQNIIVMLPMMSILERIKFSKRKYMMTITDILKKSILRALRNEYECYFKEFLHHRNYSSSYDLQKFKSHLSEYAEYLKHPYTPEALQVKYGDLGMLPFIWGLFINFWKVKRFTKTVEENRLMNLLYEVLYRYSHTKFNEFIRIPACRFLYEQILKREFLEAFLERHKTLRKSKIKYRACAENLISLLSDLHQPSPVNTDVNESQMSLKPTSHL